MRLVVGISGASGAIIGVEVLRAIRQVGGWETHLVITKGGEKTLTYETELEVDQLRDWVDVIYPIDDLGAPIASGSFKTDGMIVAPCSLKTVAGIAAGYSDNLLLRAVDVCLKERRRVVLAPREAPLNGIHLRNLLTAHQEGCLIIPTVMTFYHHPQTITEMIDHLVGKLLQPFGFETQHFRTWTGFTVGE